MTWKQSKTVILEEYIKGFKNKGYKEETLRAAIKRCQFLEDNIKQSLIWNLKTSSDGVEKETQHNKQ